MLFILTVVIGCIACRSGPRLLIDAIATIVSVLTVLSSRRARHALIVCGFTAREHATTWDRNPTWRERRLLRTSLKAAVRSTELTSLFPNIAVRAYGLANLIERADRL